MDDAGLAEAYRRKLLLPQYGNYVSHERLFNGEIETPPFTPSPPWCGTLTQTRADTSV